MASGRRWCDPAGEDLLSKDVGVTCVLSELAEDLEEQCPDGAGSSAGDQLVEIEGGEVPVRRLPPILVGRLDRPIVSLEPNVNEASTVAGMPISAYVRAVIAWSNQTPSTNVACLTSPSRVVLEGTRLRHASSSVRSFKESCSARLYSLISSSVRSRNSPSQPGC